MPCERSAPSEAADHKGRTYETQRTGNGGAASRGIRGSRLFQTRRSATDQGAGGARLRAGEACRGARRLRSEGRGRIRRGRDGEDLRLGVVRRRRSSVSSEELQRSGEVIRT